MPHNGFVFGSPLFSADMEDGWSQNCEISIGNYFMSLRAAGQCANLPMHASNFRPKSTCVKSECQCISDVQSPHPLKLCTAARRSPTLSPNANPSILPRTAVVAMIARKNFRGQQSARRCLSKGKASGFGDRPVSARPQSASLLSTTGEYTIRAHKWLIQ